MPMDHDPERGEFPVRLEFDDEVDENVLAGMASSGKPDYGLLFFQCAELTPSQACRKVPIL